VGDFEQLAPAALALADVPFREGDLEMLRLVALTFEPSIEALDGAELAQLPLEGDLDPSRPPRGPAA
jgi:hypothetical protein